MEKTPLKIEDIIIGKPLEWSAVDKNGKELLKEGSIVSSPKLLEILCKRGLYRQESVSQATTSSSEPEKIVKTKPSTPKTSGENPFEQYKQLVKALPPIFNAIVVDGKAPVKDIVQFCSKLQKLCKTDIEAALALVHIKQKIPYSISHPINTTILNEIIATETNQPISKITVLRAASFTCNISMYKIQDILNSQKTPLNDKQFGLILQHPTQSEKILRKAGVSDESWLKIVRSHHEKCDGSGYPDKISHKEIPMESQLISLTDAYLAMTSKQVYKKMKVSKKAMGELYSSCKVDDQKLIQGFIKNIGIYPPGSYVKLSTKEIAVVTHRNTKIASQPTVSSIIDPNGKLYKTPISRQCSDSISITGVHYIDIPLALNYEQIWGY